MKWPFQSRRPGGQPVLVFHDAIIASLMIFSSADGDCPPAVSRGEGAKAAPPTGLSGPRLYG